MSLKACKKCRLLVSGEVCPTCKDSELTKNWEGYIVIVDVNSESAKAIGATSPGKYALKIK
ncbi:MAG: transcription elongation factor subunit Spt4 [Candidatus Micrarchaeia archaeon]